MRRLASERRAEMFTAEMMEAMETLQRLAKEAGIKVSINWEFEIEARPGETVEVGLEPLHRWNRGDG